MNLNHVESALEAAERMVRARAALQSMFGEEYPKIIRPWVHEIEEKMARKQKSPVEVLCDMAEQELDQMLQLMMLAATLEVVTRQARSNIPFSKG